MRIEIHKSPRPLHRRKRTNVHFVCAEFKMRSERWNSRLCCPNIDCSKEFGKPRTQHCEISMNLNSKLSRTITRTQVRELDRRAIEEFGVPGIVLMENAGRGATEKLIEL